MTCRASREPKQRTLTLASLLYSLPAVSVSAVHEAPDAPHRLRLTARHTARSRGREGGTGGEQGRYNTDDNDLFGVAEELYSKHGKRVQTLL